ncbi:MAG TPA: DUF2911 domain-containing protein [Bryobacteraceae bacterium]|nr:DUF2911 domain-containing protein [Bryobacteraceae bacterium]
MKRAFTSIFVIAAAASLLLAQAPKKFARATDNARVVPNEFSTKINGKNIIISYSAPSMRGRKIFGDGGILAKGGGGFTGDGTIWRAGADEATCIHTDAPLDINGLAVPAGDYSLWVDIDSGKWQLIVNKQSGQFGTDYNPAQDLGRVAMTMGKTPATVEQFKISLTPAGGNRGRLALEWENTMASVNITVK